MSTFMSRTAVRIAVVVGAAAALSLTAVVPANAHVSANLYGATAKSGGYGVMFLRVPHGCGGDTTNAVTMTIPAGVDPAGVKPQNKAGWTISRTGSTITWSGGELRDNEFDDFGVNLKWPTLNAGEASRILSISVVQRCNAELTVTKAGGNTTVSALFDGLANKEVSLFSGDTRVTRAKVAADGSVAITVPSTDVTGPITVRRAGVIIGNDTASSAAWTQVKGDGSDQKYPAPTVTIMAATASAH
jgi:uncharacterized protein YcnI